MTVKKKATLGFVWVTISFALTQFLNFISLIPLARILDSDDFGYFSLITIIIFFVTTISEFGLGAALVQQKEMDQETTDTAFTIIISLTTFFLILTLILSPFLVSLFDKAEIYEPLQVMIITILFISLGVVPTSLLERELNFKQRTIVEILPGVGRIFVSIGLALLGAGLWSLVGGAIIGSGLSTFLAWKLTDFRPHFKVDFKLAKYLLSFGKHITFGTMLLYLAVNLDRLSVGYIADATTLGYYGLGLTIGSWVGNLAPLINKVIFPTFSRLQGDPQQLREAYVRILRFVVIISFPITAGIYLIAPHMVLIMYGEKWLPSVIFIRILVIYGLLRNLNSVIGPVFASRGKPEISTQMVVLRLLLLIPLTLILALTLGAIGVGLATTIAMGLATLYALVLTAKELMVSKLQIVKPILVATAATIFMSIGVGLAAAFLPINIFTFIALIFLGASLYLLSLVILSPQHLMTEFNEMRSLFFPGYSWLKKKLTA